MATTLREVQPNELPDQPPKQQVYSYPVWDRWITHPGRRLTPQRLLAAYDSADEGDPLDQVDIFRDRLEADAHLRAICSQRVRAVARKRWVILPGGDSAADQRAAELLEQRLRMVPNFQRTCAYQLGANFYGYSGTEIEWAREDGVTAPVWFCNVPRRRFRFSLEDDSPLLLTEKATLGEPLVPGSWWWSIADDELADGGVTAAGGLLRTACWWSLFKGYSVRDWLVWANRYGIPNVHGVYDAAEASPQDIEVLKKAVKMLGADGWAVLSDACQITITQAQQGGKADDVHGALANMCDTQNSKLIIGATENIETGTAGSYAQARVHADRSFGIVESDADQIQQSFEMAIGVPFCHYNGLDARPPRLHFHVVQDQSPGTRATIFGIARNEIGVALDADQVRQELQLKKPVGEALEPPPPTTPKPAAPAREREE